MSVSTFIAAHSAQDLAVNLSPNDLERWRLVSFQQIRLTLDDSIVSPSYTQVQLPQWTHLIALRGDEVAALALGRHRALGTLVVWFFDGDQLKASYSGAGYVEGGFIATGRSNDEELYGPDKQPWPMFWARLKAHQRHSREVTLQVASTAFQLVQSLPPGYPAPIRSTEVDQMIKEAVQLRDVQFCVQRGKRTLCWWFSRGTSPPLGIGLRFRFETSTGEPLLTPSVGVALAPDLGGGHELTTNNGHNLLCDALNDTVAFGGDMRRLDRWWDQLLSSKTVPIRVVLYGDSLAAALSPGCDTYWAGRLEINLPAKLGDCSR